MKKATNRAILLAHQAGFIPTDWALWSSLVRRATTAARLAEFACNGSPIRERVRYGMHDDERKRLDRLAAEDEERTRQRDERNDAKLIELAEALGLEIELQGDPRGAVVRVRGQGIRGNWFGGDNWFVVA